MLSEDMLELRLSIEIKKGYVNLKNKNYFNSKIIFSHGKNTREKDIEVKIQYNYC